MTTSHAATTVRHYHQNGPRTALSASLSAEPPVARVSGWAERGRSYVTEEIRRPPRLRRREGTNDMTPKMWLRLLRLMSLLGTFGIALAASPLPWPRLIALFALLVIVILTNMGIAVISDEKHQRESARAVE